MVLEFPEFLIFLNTGNKYSLQWRQGVAHTSPDVLQGTDYETVTDAYIDAQVHLGNLELKDGLYVPVQK
jgi:hypothetical protein